VKHLILITLLIAAPYALWQCMNSEMRGSAISFAKRHGVRFLIVVAVLFLLFVMAVQTKPFQLF